MKKNLVLLFLFLQACSSATLPPQPIVDHVEILRFMGKWYVIANIPTRFEKGAERSTETYTWNKNENRIDVDFTFMKDGKQKKIPQKAFIYNHDTNSEWRVQPFWPFKFAYLIVELSPDYSDTIIGVPDRENVWIMARTPHISDARYEVLVSKVKLFGYDVSKLEKVPQL